MIRKYEAKDLEQLLEAWYQASQVAHHFLTEEFFDQERINIRDIYLERAAAWVYEEAGQVVAFLSLFDNEVGGIFIHPEFQGKGMGRSLMDKAREGSEETLELEVYKDNLNARGFYEHYGFVVIHEYFFEDTGHLMLRMRLA
jgi:putative acetyltransferase